MIPERIIFVSRGITILVSVVSAAAEQADSVTQDFSNSGHRTTASKCNIKVRMKKIKRICIRTDKIDVTFTCVKRSWRFALSYYCFQILYRRIMQFINRRKFARIFAIKVLKCRAMELLIARVNHTIERTGIIRQPVNVWASSLKLNLLTPELFFLILAHPVYKM